jgi:hypothetical protein
VLLQPGRVRLDRVVLDGPPLRQSRQDCNAGDLLGEQPKLAGLGLVVLD